jgi:hypothetical protein
VKTINGIGVQFEKHRNVVGKRYTVAFAISVIHKYEKEHRHIKVNKMEDPHLYHWIMHDKAVSATIIEQGYGNDKFNLPHLISLHKLGLIVLPYKFKLQPELMQKGTESGNVLVEKKSPIKLKVTKVVAPMKTSKTTQKAPMKMRKITQKFTTLATHSSPRKKKPSPSVPSYPLAMRPPHLHLEMSIVSTTTPNVPDGSPVLNVPVATTSNASTVLSTTITPYVSVPNVVALPDIKLPYVVHPVGATQSVVVATRQSDEEVDKVLRRQHLSHASSPTPSLEDYKIGPGDLTVFTADPSKTHLPAVFEPIATRIRTTRPREVTNVTMTPA